MPTAIVEMPNIDNIVNAHIRRYATKYNFNMELKIMDDDEYPDLRYNNGKHYFNFSGYNDITASVYNYSYKGSNDLARYIYINVGNSYPNAGIYKYCYKYIN